MQSTISKFRSDHILVSDSLQTFGSPSPRDIEAVRQYLSTHYNDSPVAIWKFPLTGTDSDLRAHYRANDASCNLCTVCPVVIVGLVFLPVLPLALCSVCGVYGWKRRREEVKRTLYVLGTSSIGLGGSGDNNGFTSNCGTLTTLYVLKRGVSKKWYSFGMRKGEWKGEVVVKGEQLTPDRILDVLMYVGNNRNVSEKDHLNAAQDLLLGNSNAKYKSTKSKKGAESKENSLKRRSNLKSH